ASSDLSALLNCTPSLKACVAAAALAFALAASSLDIPPPAAPPPPPGTSLRSRLAMSRWMSMSCVCDRSPLDAVTLYLPGARPTWMYSPFFLDLVSISRFVDSLCSTTFAPSTGLPCASRTLPLICPVCANAGAANVTRPVARAQTMSVRRMVALVMGDPSKKQMKRYGGSQDPPRISLHRAAGDVSDEVLADRTAAGRTRIDGAARSDRRGPEPGQAGARMPGVELPDLRRGGIAEQDRCP